MKSPHHYQALHQQAPRPDAVIASSDDTQKIKARARKFMQTQKLDPARDQFSIVDSFGNVLTAAYKVNAAGYLTGNIEWVAQP